jgi:type 1 glutamine amidotransferase
MKSEFDNISRRSLLRQLGTAGIALSTLTSNKHAWSQSAESGTGRGRRALALVGDRYHNSDYIRVSLNRVFGALDIPIDYTTNYDELSHDLLSRYQLFLVLRDGMIWPDGYLGPDAYTHYEADLENPHSFPEPKPQTWIKEPQAAAIRDFVNAGNGFYALHNSSHISLSSKTFRDVMGGAYIGHPPLRPFKVRPVNQNHPITRGITEFIVNDEQHYVEYDKDRKYLLFEAENTDGLTYQNLGTKSISGWAYDYGSGRVVFTAVGHTIHAMWNPQYIEIQKRSVQWLLKQI